MEELLLHRIQQSPNIDSKSSAIAVAKSSGQMEQKGKNLSLTKKGKKAAKKARSKK